MAVVTETVSLSADTLQRIQRELRSHGLDGWLLYNFHGLNSIASALLGLPALTRRYLVLIPAAGQPVALTHRIEQHPWAGWIGENRVYLSWRELEAELAEMLTGVGRIAMEYVPGDAVPYVDMVPAGALEMVRATGAEVVPSADLVSAFHARWTAEGEASHRRASAAVQQTAHAAFARIGDAVRGGKRLTEWELREWICAELVRRGLAVGGDSIVAVNAHAANPHYAPSAEQSAEFRTGDLVLIDLWGKEDSAAVYADQTWMGFVGDTVPPRIQGIWEAVRDARDAAVEHARARWAAGEPVAGWELDDAARAVITERGYGDAFIHRTGHSIDQELHGSGPNLDNLETRDTRLLIPGVGFSVEPGIYLPGDIGFRSEINVWIGPDGPEVTTPEPQSEVLPIMAATSGR
ncbi:MAG: aminopeptidase P family protein [Gemmatimonadetes bacterium]|nr:aminopeptidase P family protein [Gemmatimonadota bacterium]